MIILFFRCSWRTTVSPNAFGAQRKPQSQGQTAAYPNGFGAQEVEGELPQILEYFDYVKDAKICLIGYPPMGGLKRPGTEVRVWGESCPMVDKKVQSWKD